MTRNLVVGDIHGCYRAMRKLFDIVEPETDDVIVTLGDYCDRGADTASVIDWLINFSAKYQLKPLRGNHDIMMLKADEDDGEFVQWLKVGGDTTLKSYSDGHIDEFAMSDIPQSHWRWLQEDLLPYYECDTHFFVHANAYPDVPLSEQPEFMLYWEKFEDPAPHESGKVMVCGHTTQRSGQPVTNGHSICIDTWAYGHGWLTCLDVDSGRIWQANELGKTRKYWLNDVPVLAET